MIHNIILGRIFQIYSEKLKDTAIKRYTHGHTIYTALKSRLNRVSVQRLVGRRLDLESRSVSRIRRADATAVSWQGWSIMQ
jgi:hypothetical protein